MVYDRAKYSLTDVTDTQIEKQHAQLHTGLLNKPQEVGRHCMPRIEKTRCVLQLKIKASLLKKLRFIHFPGNK